MKIANALTVIFVGVLAWGMWVLAADRPDQYLHAATSVCQSSDRGTEAACIAHAIGSANSLESRAYAAVGLGAGGLAVLYVILYRKGQLK